MRISFDYFDAARERGREWAETLPETLQTVCEYFAIIFAINARGVWISEAGHVWELCGTRRDAREYLAALARDNNIK